jgi:hypothetical protein
MSLPLLPFKELLEQGLAVLGAQAHAIALFGEELREVAPRIRYRHRIRVLREPILRRFEADPTGQRGGERDFLPLGVEGRFLEFVDLRKEDLDEMREPSIAIRIGCPIIRGEHRRHRDRVDALPLFDEFRIVLVLELRRQIVDLQRLCVLDRNEMD